MLKSLGVGLLSRMPGSSRLVRRRIEAPDSGTDYAVALKHLTLMQLARAGVPEILLELGPGASLGVGVTALLLGARRYVALDVERHIDRAALDPDRVLRLARLIRERAPLRNADGFPSLRAYLDATGFPRWLADWVDRHPIDEQRVQRVQACVAQLRGGDAASAHGLSIDYVVPWDRGAAPASKLAGDAVLSHAVLQHAQDPSAVHRRLACFSKDGAICTHQIAYGSHGLSSSWNGHWTYGDRVWALMLGKRRYLLNRMSHTQHVDALAAAGFATVAAFTSVRYDGVARTRLAPAFRTLSDDDLNTAGGFLVLRLTKQRTGQAP